MCSWPAGVPEQRWSMQVPSEVSAEAGDAAMLPCTFTHPHRHYDGPLTAIWRAGEPYAGPQVFRCTAARGSELCQTALSLQGRFRLLGNPRHNDLSLRVERLALADSGRYFCRVEFAGDAHDRYESRHGVRLRVTGEVGWLRRRWYPTSPHPCPESLLGAREASENLVEIQNSDPEKAGLGRVGHVPMLINTGNSQGRREKQPIILTWQGVQEEYVSPALKNFSPQPPTPAHPLSLEHYVNWPLPAVVTLWSHTVESPAIQAISNPNP